MAAVLGYLVAVVALVVVGTDNSIPVVGNILPRLVCNPVDLHLALELFVLQRQLQQPAVDSIDNMQPMLQNNQAVLDLGLVADLVAVPVAVEVAVHQIVVVVRIAGVAAAAAVRIAGVAVAVQTAHIVVANCLAVVAVAAAAAVVGSSLVDSSFVHHPG